MKKTTRISQHPTVRHRRTTSGKVLSGAAPKNSTEAYKTLERQNRRLKRELDRLRTEIAHCRAEHNKATLANGEFHRRNSEADSFTQLERRDESLINMFVAVTRLHSSPNRAGVLTAIREILSDVIGCREMAIFEIDYAQGILSPIGCVDIQTDQIATIRVGDGQIGEVAQTGKAFFGVVGDGNLIACVPLKIADRMTGVIAVFGLLEQKSELQAGDRELLHLLSTQAGLALHRATIQGEWNAANGAVG